MAIQTRTIEYLDHDILLEAYMAYEDTGSDRRPGVLVSHAWAGRSEFEENKAERLAELGYVGFALDLYGKGVQGSNPQQNEALMQPLLDDRSALQQRMQLALEVLKKQKEVDGNRTAAMGFCFGGLCVLDLARSGVELGGAASFHGLLGAPGNTTDNKIKAKILIMHGWGRPDGDSGQGVGRGRRTFLDGCGLADSRLWQHRARIYQSGGRQCRDGNRL